MAFKSSDVGVLETWGVSFRHFHKCVLPILILNDNTLLVLNFIVLTASVADLGEGGRDDM